MKNQLNKTITVIQKLTNKIVDIKEKTDEFLVEQDYSVLQNKINELQTLFNSVKKVTINVENYSSGYGLQPTINGITYSCDTMVLRNPITQEIVTQIETTYPITFDFPFNSSGMNCEFKISDKNNNIIYESTEKMLSVLQSGPEYIYIYAYHGPVL